MTPLKDKLQAGEPVLGTWSVVPSPTVVEILAGAGLSFVILDMEHGPWDLTGVQEAAMACELHGCAPLVRVANGSATKIQSALDTGAHGVIVPQVRGADDCRAVVRAATLPPRGTRGHNPFTRAGGYDPAAPGGGLKFEHDFVLRGVIVEKPEAWDQLDEILAIDDLDLVYLGVYDMSLTSGWGASDPARVDFLETGVRRCRAAGKAAGLMVRSAEEIAWALGLGATFCVYSVDSSLLHGAIGEAAAAFADWRPA